MNRRNIVLLVCFSAIGIIIIFGTAMLSLGNNPAPFTSDDELIAKTKELPEVQAFLSKYPNTTAWVDRGSDIHVSHAFVNSSKSLVPHDNSNASLTKPDYLSISVWMGSKSLRTQQISLLCSGGDVYYLPDSKGWTRENHFQINDSEIILYLQQNKEKECFM